MSVGVAGFFLMRPAANGKKQFVWCEVWVLMDLSFLSEGSDWNSVRDGRDQPQSFLLASESWRRTGPGVMVDCSQSLLCKTNDTLWSAFVLWQWQQGPDGDGGGEDGLHDGGVDGAQKTSLQQRAGWQVLCCLIGKAVASAVFCVNMMGATRSCCGSTFSTFSRGSLCDHGNHRHHIGLNDTGANNTVSEFPEWFPSSPAENKQNNEEKPHCSYITASSLIIRDNKS